MKLNPRKIHSITISRSRTPYPPHPLLTLCGFDLKVSSFFRLLVVILDNKLTFEKHIRNIVSSIAQKLVLFANITRLVAIEMQYPNPFRNLFCFNLHTVPLFGALHLILI